MTGEVDAVGQLVDAGLLGAAIEAGGTAHGPAGGVCANCGSAVAENFCQKCGQRCHVHRSLLHLAEEFFHGLLHFDGKFWRTAPLLLIRPGALTRRYVEGQRVRFVSPIALFLFSVFLMFFAVSTVEAPKEALNGGGLPAEERAQLQKELSQAAEQLKQASGDQKKLAVVRSAVEKAEQAVENPEAAADDDDVFATPLGLDWRAVSRKLAQKKNFKMIGDDAMQQRVRASLADPDLLVYKMRSAASEYSFMLVPASVPFLWLMFFWRRRVYLYDHVIFALHSLSFMALFIGGLSAAYDLRPTLNPWGWLMVVPPLHMFFHLKGAYGLGLIGAFWRTCFLSLVALIVLFSYAAAILVLGLVH